MRAGDEFIAPRTEEGPPGAASEHQQTTTGYPFVSEQQSGQPRNGGALRGETLSHPAPLYRRVSPRSGDAPGHLRNPCPGARLCGEGPNRLSSSYTRSPRRRRSPARTGCTGSMRTATCWPWRSRTRWPNCSEPSSRTDPRTAIAATATCATWRRSAASCWITTGTSRPRRTTRACSGFRRRGPGADLGRLLRPDLYKSLPLEWRSPHPCAGDHPSPSPRHRAEQLLLRAENP